MLLRVVPNYRLVQGQTDVWVETLQIPYVVQVALEQLHVFRQHFPV